MGRLVRSLFFGLLILILAFSTASARLADNKKVSSESKPYGGTLHLGFDQKPLKLNPILTNRSLSMGVMALVFNRLVRYNANGEIEPELAESWEITSNNSVYTFHLKKGVKFHNGVELTADDVYYTLSSIKDPANQSPHAFDFDIVQKFEVVDRYIFRVNLKEPSASFLCNLIREIVPKHLYELAAIEEGDFNFRPIGSGPFKFKGWDADDTITLEANADYFEGRPYLDKIIYKTYPSRSEAWSALMRGEIDLMIFMSTADYEITKQDSMFKTYAYPAPEYYALFYNLEDPLLSDIKIRQAIACAVDRKALIERLEKGYGRECVGSFPKASSEIQVISYDPQRAKNLLFQAGWQIEGKGEEILKKNGRELVVRIFVDSAIPKLKKIAMLIRQQLQEVGIKVEIQLHKDEHATRKESPQAYLWMALGVDFDLDASVRYWHSKDRRKGRFSFAGAYDAEIDQLIEAGQKTSDEKMREQTYRRIHRLIYEKQPACFLYFPYYFHASREAIGGAEKYLNVYMPVYAIKDFYIDGKIRKGGD